jgi:hypothetical protein
MTNLPKADLNEAAGAADTAWVAEQQAAVAEVRLGHKEGGSCDPFTQRMLEELQRRNYSEGTTEPICKQSNSSPYTLG